MKVECIELLVDAKREIEFTYNHYRYSITYYNDKREKYISFSSPNQKPIDVSNSYELLKINIGGKSLESIFKSLPDSSIDIF